MRVVCDGCQAKYQIPEGRVAGRKVKIRCRRCGEAILIRGDQLPAQSAAPLSEATGSEAAAWYFSTDGEQQGAYPLAQVAELLRNGQLPWDAFVWREGYADWKFASESDTVVRAVAAGVTALAPTEGSIEAGEELPTRMMQASQVSPALQSSSREAFAARASLRRSSPPFELDAMTGGRNEDSVLFSANNLRASMLPAQRASTGHATGEGSGLIDIRALAALARSNAPAPAPAMRIATPSIAPQRAVTDVALVNQSGAFANIDSLRPVSRPPRPVSKALPIAIVSTSAAIAAAALVGVILVQRQASVSASDAVPMQAPAAAAQPFAAPPTTPLPAAEAAVTDSAPEPTAAPVVAAPEPSPATQAARRVEPIARATKSSRAARRAKTRAEESPQAKIADVAPKAEPPSVDAVLLGDTAPVKAEPEPVAAPEPVKIAAPAPAADRSLDDLLNGAVPSKTKTATATAADSSVPESPSRDQVRAAMRSVQGAVRACGQGATLEQPTVSVAVTAAGTTGRVSSARVTGAQGEIAACIEKAVSNASFGTFSKPEFTVSFPFKLQ